MRGVVRGNRRWEGFQVTALEKYKELLRQATELERMAEPDASGGQTFWSNMHDCTKFAVSNASFVPTYTYQLPPESIRAIHLAAPRSFDAIWREAARMLRESASRMKAELEQQAVELKRSIEELEK